MIPVTQTGLRTLRLGLLLSSIGWGVSLVFTFSTWDSDSNYLYQMGAGMMKYKPLLDYWLRMASATFGCIGVASALACVRPVFFQGLILLLGPFHLFLGVVLTVAAIGNHLHAVSHSTYVADITFCFLTAILIITPLTAAFFRRYERTAPIADGNLSCCVSGRSGQRCLAGIPPDRQSGCRAR